MSEPATIGVNEHTGQAMTVPENVVDAVRRADKILKLQLRQFETLSIDGEWNDYKWSEEAGAGWQVSLRVFSPDYSFVNRVRVSDLHDPLTAKDVILDTFLDFSGSVSIQVGEIIRQVRSDLKKMLAS